MKRLGDAALPIRVDPPVGGMADDRTSARACQAHIGKPRSSSKTLRASFIQRTLVGEQTLFPARQKHRIELQSLGAVQGHQANSVTGSVLIVLHHQRDMVEKATQSLEVGQRANQFLQILQPSRSLGRIVLLPHVGVAALVEQSGDGHDMALAVQHLPPASNISQQCNERPFSLTSQPVSRTNFVAASKSGIPSRALSHASRALPSRRGRVEGH